MRTRHAGVFLFWPLLAQLRFDRIVQEAGEPGTKMVPAANVLMSLLTLKLLDKERLSHIDDLNCDEALGLFAGLNILPKKSFATDYSYRTTRSHQEKLLQGWVSKLSPLLFPEANSFSLDFHPIGHRGEKTDLENHYQPQRGKAGPSVLTFFAMEQKSQVFCYANANLTREQQAGEVLRFVEFWHGLTGHYPLWLYFDSKLTTYAQLSSEVRLNIDLDTVLTVLANGCYRWLASRLHGFDQAQPKSLSRKFVETAGTVEIVEGRRLVVTFDRRSHNPILREAQLDKDHPKIPWLAGHQLEFVYA